MLHPTTPTRPAPERSRAPQRTHPAQRVQVIERWNQWVRVRFAETGEESWVDLAETSYSPTGQSGPVNNSKNSHPHEPRPSDNGS